MKNKSFENYAKACEFRDKVNGQTEWCTYKSNDYWVVWYEEALNKDIKVKEVEKNE